MKLILPILLLSVVAMPATAGSDTNFDPSLAAPAVCFAPDSTQEGVDAAYARAAAAQIALSLLPPDLTEFTFSDGNRWSATALSGGGLTQGDPTIITWSIVPDGTPIAGFNGEPAAPSNFIAFLNGIYTGGQAEWHELFVQIFDTWSGLTGLSYVFEPNDDGVGLATAGAGGVAGVRGDVRIGGHFIDGNSNVLAYNFFPNTSDMVIDTGDNFYTNTGNNSQGLRNVLAHEHGHGLGLSHVCPVSQTKLMEPFVSFAFDGPQFDDVAAINRGYGDAFEPNDTPGTATSVGTVGNSIHLYDPASVDDNSDVNHYGFTLEGAGDLSATVTPIGGTYLSGPQNANGSCTPGTNFNAGGVHNLSIDLLNGAGGVVMSVNATGNGSPETLTASGLAPDTYSIRVQGDTTNQVQMYTMEYALSNITTGGPIFSDNFETGGVAAWTGVVP